MVFVTIGKAGLVCISAIVLQQFLQRRKWRIVRVLAVTAIFKVQILSALDAQPFAILVMKGIDRHFKQGVFSQHRSQVDLPILGE